MEAGDLATVRARVFNVVGHELRTPITTIRGLAEALARADADRIRNELAPALLRLARRVERLLDDLLLGSGIPNVLPTEAPAEIELAEAVHEAWAGLGAADPPKLELEVEGTARCAAPADALDRILSAILDNAAKYGESPVAVQISEAGDRAHVLVDSPGRDVPDYEIRCACEPFFRGEAAVMRARGSASG